MLQDNNGSHNGMNGHGHGHEPKNIIRFPDAKERSNKKTDPSTPKVPMINLPPVTKYFVTAFLVIQVAVFVTSLIDPELENLIYIVGSFTPASWAGLMPFAWWTPLTLITFSFLHNGWFHVGVNTVMMMAFGTGVERWLGWQRMLVLFAVSTLGALLCHFALYPHSTTGIVGASGAISGFFGALLLMLKQQRALGQKNSILPFIILWIVISVVFGMMGAPDGGEIAWVAHIGGFFAGLGTTWWMLRR